MFFKSCVLYQLIFPWWFNQMSSDCLQNENIWNAELGKSVGKILWYTSNQQPENNVKYIISSAFHICIITEVYHVPMLQSLHVPEKDWTDPIKCEWVWVETWHDCKKPGLKSMMNAVTNTGETELRQTNDHRLFPLLCTHVNDNGPLSPSYKKR